MACALSDSVRAYSTKPYHQEDGSILRPCMVDTLLEYGEDATGGLQSKNFERSQQAVATVTYTGESLLISDGML